MNMHDTRVKKRAIIFLDWVGKTFNEDTFQRTEYSNKILTSQPKLSPVNWNFNQSNKVVIYPSKLSLLKQSFNWSNKAQSAKIKLANCS